MSPVFFFFLSVLLLGAPTVLSLDIRHITPLLMIGKAKAFIGLLGPLLGGGGGGNLAGLLGGGGLLGNRGQGGGLLGGGGGLSDLLGGFGGGLLRNRQRGNWRGAENGFDQYDDYGGDQIRGRSVGYRRNRFNNHYDTY
uniref:Uncharacterized protein n=1 Tax=Trichuris muris TaxID=70415 RepID=A0A5S6QKJ2_TRIMR